MSVDRDIWLNGFSGNGPTPWPCPKCNGARLHLVKDSLYKQETSDSVEAHSHLAWEPEWIDGRFICMLRCPDCTDPSAVAGTYTAETGYIDVGHGEEPEPQLVETYRPKFFSDPPPIIRAPRRVPTEITDELEKSFRLYWGSSEACANSIRSVVERLLTHFGIRRWTTNNKRKRVRITTHNRIELYRKKNAVVASQLEAVKWIGNAGSHPDVITKGDLLDGYELLEDILEQLFDGKGKRMARLSHQINKKKGPRSARRGH